MEGNSNPGTQNQEIQLSPMSLREIQAQGGRISSGPTTTSLRPKKKKKSFPRIPEEEGGKRVVQDSLLLQESPRWTCRMDEQLAAAQRNSTLLDEQVKCLRQENGEMKGFIRDVLYTLNARGYESIGDCRGGTIDLNRCRGERFLELKGRDARARQHSPARRIQAQEHLLKAVIGSQEKLIRNLINQVNTNQRNEIIGARLTSEIVQKVHGNESETDKSTLLEKEILSLVNSLESALGRSPAIYTGLKEQLFLEASRPGGGSTGILSAVLARHQLTIGERVSLSSPRSEGNRPRSSTQQMRRKLVTYYAGDSKRNFIDEHLTSAPSGGGSFRQRPPTPSLGFTSRHEEEPGPGHGTPFALRPVVSNKNLFSAPPLTVLPGRRPVTSINEYSSRQKIRGRSRWASPNSN